MYIHIAARDIRSATESGVLVTTWPNIIDLPIRYTTAEPRVADGAPGV